MFSSLLPSWVLFLSNGDHFLTLCLYCVSSVRVSTQSLLNDLWEFRNAEDICERHVKIWGDAESCIIIKPKHLLFILHNHIASNSLAISETEVLASQHDPPSDLLCYLSPPITDGFSKHGRKLSRCDLAVSVLCPSNWTEYYGVLYHADPIFKGRRLLLKLVWLCPLLMNFHSDIYVSPPMLNLAAKF